MSGIRAIPARRRPTRHSRTLGDTAALQTAVNAYAAIGVPATCATYTTVNQGGTLVNDQCQVQGSNSWHDANLTALMSPAQLAAELAQEKNPTATYGPAYVQAPGAYAPIIVGASPPNVTQSTAIAPLFGPGAPTDTVQSGPSVSRPSVPVVIVTPPPAATAPPPAAPQIPLSINYAPIVPTPAQSTATPATAAIPAPSQVSQTQAVVPCPAYILAMQTAGTLPDPLYSTEPCFQTIATGAITWADGTALPPDPSLLSTANPFSIASLTADLPVSVQNAIASAETIAPWYAWAAAAAAATWWFTRKKRR
jgi:hypothetical protein